MRRQALYLTRISCIPRIRGLTYGLTHVAASALALCALLPILGAVALQAAPTAHAAGSCINGCIHWDGSMIYAGQNNGNPEGPVGEHALVHGEGFLLVTGQHVRLQLVKGDVNTAGDAEFCRLNPNKVALPGTATVDGSGTFDFSFDWPATASGDLWSICAYRDADNSALFNTDDGPFSVLSANPPSIALSTDNIQPGQAVTITGKNWLPAQGGIFVYIGPCADCGGAPVVSTTLSSDASGNFSVSLPIPSNTAPATYIASAHNQSGVLDLINNGPHLTAAAPTATTAPSPTVTSAPTATATKASAGNGGGNTSSSNGGGSNTGLLIGLVVAIVALLAALAGILAYLATQRRNAAPIGSNGPSGPNGPGGYGQAFGANTNPAGRYGPPDPFAAPYHPPATPPPLPDWDPGATTDPGRTAPDDTPTQAGFFPPPADPHGR